MKTKQKFMVTLIAIIIIATGSLQAKVQDFWLGGSIGQFSPSDETFKELYDPGFQWRLAIGVDILKWMTLWADTVFTDVTGELTVTHEESKITMKFLNAGIRFKFPIKKFTPYIGGGAGIIRYTERNPIGEARAKDNNILGEAGLMWEMSKLFSVNLRLLYNWCQVRPELVKAKIGGLSASVGIDFYFGKLFKEKKRKVWEW